ncbi:MAG: alpha/beta hydrolase family protein, partial [Sphingopyxis sp.]
MDKNIFPVILRIIRNGRTVAAGILAFGLSTSALAQAQLSLAQRFGALENISDVSFSPDGAHIAYISPGAGQAAALYVVGTQEGATPVRVLRSSGDPERLGWCEWASNTRILCQIFTRGQQAGMIIQSSSLVALDADGTHLTMLSNGRGDNALFVDFRGGSVLDWLPDDPQSVLMQRTYVPEMATGTNIRHDAEGVGVDRVDVATGRARPVVRPSQDVSSYITDGLGAIRIKVMQDYDSETGRTSSILRYFHRPAAGGEWAALGTYNIETRQGIAIVAMDAATNRAIGFQRIDGRQAAVSVGLDGTGDVRIAYAHGVVDVDDVLRVGRNRRIVGYGFATDRRNAVYTDQRFATMAASLSRALGGQSISIADSSMDETQHLIHASADTEPGKYFLYAPAARQLRPLLAVRPNLAALPLSPMRAVQYPAGDGTMIPAYLTLPPGRTDARGLPAIVVPHGGPSSRDEWGFDWLSQFLAQSGYAVIQPNFRGSDGFGDDWYMKNGFQSWRVAVGDVADAGRWMVQAQGADAARLSIVGWSYGGYAALQSGVLAPGLFKAIVAIAPVTDLEQLRADALDSTMANADRRFIGTGPHLREGSPARNAGVFAAPVLMFHGTQDVNVPIDQSRRMQQELARAGRPVEL